MTGESRGRGASGLSTELLEVLGDIYQAGLEPERWPDAIARMSRVFAADLACIYTPFPARPDQALYLTHHYTAAMESAYSAYYHRIDEWTGHALRQRRYIQGSVALGEEIVPQAELRRTEFYQDFLKPHDMEWMVTTALFDGRVNDGVDAPATHMSFTRHRGRNGYGEDGKWLIELLAPHVRRALLTHWRLSDAQRQADSHTLGLEYLGHGLLLVEEDGVPRYADAVAEALLRTEDALALRDGRLRAPHNSEDDCRLAQLIRQACIGLGGGMRLARRPANGGSSPRPYSLTALPYREDTRNPFLAALAQPARPLALLMLHDPERAPMRDAIQTLADRHHLTPAELRVLRLLLEGFCPKSIAQRLNLGIRTIRSQLSSLYAKTGARNQRELVALALNQGWARP
jgi:DNA-binding CsgD family transcriptional regulator